MPSKNETLYGRVKDWGEHVVLLPNLAEIISTHTLSPRPYKNDLLLEWTPYATLGNSPFYEPDFDVEAPRGEYAPSPRTPEKVPEYINFTYLVGSFQNLNSEQFWNEVLAHAPFPISASYALTGESLHIGNKNLFNRFLVYLPGAVILGRYLKDEILKKEHKHPAVKLNIELSNHFNTVVHSEKELRQRFIEALGTPQTHGIVSNILSSSHEMRRCPGGDISEIILSHVGGLFATDEYWEEYITIYRQNLI
jgi:hypothetical protein